MAGYILQEMLVMNNVQPHLSLLTEEQKQEIHQYVLNSDESGRVGDKRRTEENPNL